VDRIGRKMIDILDKYSKENGYSIILDTSAQNTPVIYAANTIDVTQDIIKLYDQSYPVKGSASAAKPAAAKPATPKPAPAQQQPAPR
jgi:outer membrane protein